MSSASVTAPATGSAPGSKVKIFLGHGIARDEELARLRRELETAQQERDIFKKAVSIF